MISWTDARTRCQRSRQAVAPGDSVGRRSPLMDPNECGTPRPVGGEAPKGREDAVHGGVFAAALLVGELESDVVDESQPEWRKSPGEGDEREDLGEDCRTSKTGGGGGGGGGGEEEEPKRILRSRFTLTLAA